LTIQIEEIEADSPRLEVVEQPLKHSHANQRINTPSVTYP